eukprot:g62468.t1
MVSHMTQANKPFHEDLHATCRYNYYTGSRDAKPSIFGHPQAAAAAPVKVPTMFGDITNEALGYLKKDRASIKSLLLVYVPVDSIDPADLNELSESLLSCRISSIGQLASICISCDSVGGLVRELRDTAPDGTWHLGVITVLLQALEEYAQTHRYASTPAASSTQASPSATSSSSSSSSSSSFSSSAPDGERAPRDQRGPRHPIS